MFGAASLDLYKNYKNLYYEDLIIITSGFLISFFTALLAIKLLILYLKNNNFIIFGWYRILYWNSFRFYHHVLVHGRFSNFHPEIFPL